MKLFQKQVKLIALLLGFALAISSCGKDDQPPIITLNGDGTVDVSLNGTYSDAGATASDEEDGTVSVSSDFSATKPDVNNAATYTITYTATDSEGNTATASRTVIVANDASYLVGSYGVTESPGGSVWVQSISAHTTINNRIQFSRFANYSANSGITAQVVNSGGDNYVVLNPSSQPANGIGGDGCDHLFSSKGNGAKVQQIGGKWTFSVKFSDEVTGGGGTCVVTGPIDFEDTFLQQ